MQWPNMLFGPIVHHMRWQQVIMNLQRWIFWLLPVLRRTRSGIQPQIWFKKGCTYVRTDISSHCERDRQELGLWDKGSGLWFWDEGLGLVFWERRFGMKTRWWVMNIVGKCVEYHFHIKTSLFLMECSFM